MTIKKKNFNLFLVLLILLFFIFLKNYIFCELYFGQCVGIEGKGGDLRVYTNSYNNSFVDTYKSLLFVIFFLNQFIFSFETFHLLFIMIFYIVIYLSGLKFSRDIANWKFFLFIIVILFYPIYEGYSVNSLKQGLGFIFMFMSVFLVRRIFSKSSWYLIIASSLSHYVFILFHLTFYGSRFFSIKQLTFVFYTSLLLYVLGISDYFYFFITKIINYFNAFFANDLEDLIFSPDPIYELKIDFILFSFLPLITLQVIQFKRHILKNFLIGSLYKFHLLYSSVVYLFFSNYYYFDRFLSVSWAFYPFYFLYLFQVIKFYKKKVTN